MQCRHHHCRIDMYFVLVLGRDKSYFVKGHLKSNNRYKQDEIIQMLEMWTNIYVQSGGRVFQQTIGMCIPMGTNCAPLLADLVLLYTGL